MILMWSLHYANALETIVKKYFYYVNKIYNVPFISESCNRIMYSSTFKTTQNIFTHIYITQLATNNSKQHTHALYNHSKINLSSQKKVVSLGLEAKNFRLSSLSNLIVHNICSALDNLNCIPCFIVYDSCVNRIFIYG